MSHSQEEINKAAWKCKHMNWEQQVLSSSKSGCIHIVWACLLEALILLLRHFPGCQS